MASLGHPGSKSGRSSAGPGLFAAAHAAGYARLAAWSELLDEINVFPVADGDTGRNLCISLTPLREMATCTTEIIQDRLIRTATGNSGNIAAAFLVAFLTADRPQKLAAAAAAGAREARAAIATPVAGTMLDVFDALADHLAGPDRNGGPFTGRLMPALTKSVQQTTARLPALAAADVIDAGALAIFLFFEGFFHELDGRRPPAGSLPEAFDSLLTRHPSGKPVQNPVKGAADEMCINAVVKPADHIDPTVLKQRLEGMGQSLVTLGDERALKVHFHAGDLAAANALLSGLGTVEAISGEALYGQQITTAPLPPGPVHIMTDAAGSLSRPEARQLGVTLLDSFVVSGTGAVPETLLDPEAVYRRMRAGERHSTAQASTRERHQRYAAALERFEKVLYLGVGSAYTGNVAAAGKWQASGDPEGRFIVMDTGAASGKLGLIARAVARFASRADSTEAVIGFAEKATAACGELVFIDQLKYLAAGGRISKTGGFFGDLFKFRPVITPTPNGVQKLAVVRRRSEQLPLALKQLGQALEKAPAPLLLLQYTDNRQRVAAEIQPALLEKFPAAEIVVTPLSLTSGVHMGPGTWAVAWLANGE
jgi:DegV family protein with EDD domain